MVWLFAIGVLSLLVFSRGFRKIAAWVIGLVIVAGIGYWGWLRYTERPRVVEEIAGVRLGMSPTDVKLSKGMPNVTAAPEVQSNGDYSLDWMFSTTYGPTLYVVFDGKSSESLGVSIVCEASGYTRLFGLGNYSSEKDVTGKLGVPSRTSIAESGLTKIISYSAYKVAFEIEKGSVTKVCVSGSGSVGYERELKDAATRFRKPSS